MLKIFLNFFQNMLVASGLFQNWRSLKIYVSAIAAHYFHSFVRSTVPVKIWNLMKEIQLRLLHRHIDWIRKRLCLHSWAWQYESNLMIRASHTLAQTYKFRGVPFYSVRCDHIVVYYTPYHENNVIGIDGTVYSPETNYINTVFLTSVKSLGSCKSRL